MCFLGFNALFMTYTVNHSYEESSKTSTDEFKRYGVKFDQRQSEHYDTELDPNQTIRQIFNVPIVATHKRVRRDEPELGGLIFSSSLKTIDKYIRGPPRRPFHNPSGNFVIIISRPVESGDAYLTAHILQKLWRDYRIMHLFIFASCEQYKVNCCY